MPRGRRKSTLGALESQLQALDAQRAQIIQQIQAAVSQLTSGGDAPAAPVTRRGPGRPAGTKVRKRRKLSAKARKAISDAQKKRWAKQKADAK